MQSVIQVHRLQDRRERQRPHQTASTKPERPSRAGDFGDELPHGAGTVASVQPQRPGERLIGPLVRERGDLHRGFGDALAQAFELVFTPLIFAFLGRLLDQRLGTAPLFTLGLFIAVLAYLTWRMLTRYTARMRSEEQLVRQHSSAQQRQVEAS